MTTTIRRAALLSFLLLLATGAVQADGDETLGTTPIAPGTQLLGIGAGMFVQPGNAQLFVPEGATVEQVLLYWNGFHSTMANGDDTIALNGTPVTGALIGGPRLFFTTNDGDHWSTTYRADITDLELIVPGNNVLAFTEGDFDRISNGASVVVVVNDGGALSNFQLADGQDLAFVDFLPPLDTTVEQTFGFAASVFNREALVTLIASSVEGPESGNADARPNRVRVTVDGQAPYDVITPLTSVSGFEWDHTAISVDIPAGATFVTLQALSITDETEVLPASFAWIAAALDLAEPFCGDAQIDPDETCDPPGEAAGGNGNLCRDDCTVCGDGLLDVGEDCDDGNGVNDDACRNDCTVPVCGDSIVDPQNGETCDPPGGPGGASGNECRGDCTVCGDGNVDPDEACDDGNNNDSDDCRNDCSVPECGDSIVDPQNGETCDPPGGAAGASGNECRDDCTVCGDGNVDPDEACDDGNNDDSDDCRNDCTIPECGDSIVDPQNGETCDPPGGAAGASGNECRDDCTVCGDGNVDPDEACDDGNNDDSDDCRNDCTIPECGDSIVDPQNGETCDPPGGAAGASGNECRDDCTVCGDGNVDPDEACDDGNNDDSDDCRNDCTIPECGDSIVDPQNGETCDPPGGAAGASGNECRDDCTVCGDGVTDAGEDCDDGNGIDGDACRNDCTAPVCGDGIVDPGEECDDGNLVDDDDCRNDCTIPECGDSIVDPQNGETCDPPGGAAGASGNECRDDCTVCGDGNVDPDEACDDGNNDDSDDCRNDCTIPECGDSIVDPQNGETCDPPGGAAGGNGNDCRDDCTVCGDGVTDAGEDCDDGNGIDDDACRNDCTAPVCGDGIVDPGEECDDGNLVDDDDCRNDCTIPVCGDSIVDPQNGETCDPPGGAAGGNGNDCRDDCTVCGDGILDAGEDCDDGNGSDDDFCRNDCTIPECGDSIVDPQNGETCDPPGEPGGANGNECRTDCTVCGDGIVDLDETCDDGNTDDFDDCRNDCTEPLLVDLESFTAEWTDEGVVLRWVTASEKDNVGFRLYRVAPATSAREKAEEIALHTGVIHAQGTELSGAEYTFLDNRTLEPGTYEYVLEDIDLFGTVTRHDAITVEIPETTRQAPATRGRSRSH